MLVVMIAEAVSCRLLMPWNSSAAPACPWIDIRTHRAKAASGFGTFHLTGKLMGRLRRTPPVDHINGGGKKHGGVLQTRRISQSPRCFLTRAAWK
jgi:hypothetical protein